jgi:O-methyltransferase involved in polyketide biosynthesis
VLGAGFDTRAYGPLSKQGLAMFELDQAANQRVKREAVTRAGLGGDDVNYIEVDFAHQPPCWSLDGAAVEGHQRKSN